MRRAGSLADARCGIGGASGTLFLPGSEATLWPLVFMAATLGGMMRAPIMALMFAFEVTQDANALLPLLTACATAYGFTVLLMPRSILTEKIARRGYHIYREYGIDPLERHTVSEVMTRELTTIAAHTTPSPTRCVISLAPINGTVHFRW